mmetsp:Transcript_1561/g.3100  ORF Transcript_1561/g.3100 Transcript_1561/m.3100 type:complete len:239 (-) Transcript_1561:102-818(-)
MLRIIAAMVVSALADCPRGCPERCPAQEAVQTAWVRKNFDLAKFWGVYYELAYHDNTQPHTWPIQATCMRSVKSQHPGDAKNYKDLFSLNFGAGGGKNAVCDLEFNITDKPGVFLGHWSGSMRPDLHSVSNTVVDVGVAANGSYTWSLEFQCKDDPTGGIQFVAVNFYHRNPLVADSEFQEMMQRLRARGLGWAVDVDPGLTMVDQKKCVDHASYPPIDAPVHWCGQGLADASESMIV